jgi:hypothetical protein
LRLLSLYGRRAGGNCERGKKSRTYAHRCSPRPSLAKSSPARSTRPARYAAFLRRAVTEWYRSRGLAGFSGIGTRRR